MEVRAGYQQTEVGVIPVDWSVVPFGRLFAFTNGVNADKTAYGKGIRFINVLEPISYSHIYGPEIPGRVQVSDAVASAYSVKPGDIVFNRTSETDSELGLAAVYLGNEQVVFGGFVIRGRPIDEDFDPRYAGYALRAKIIRSQIIPMGQGAVRANIGQQNLRQVLALVPPKPEQRAIATALSDVDALLDGLTRLIAKKRDLKQATMQQLLTGQTRLPGFSGAWGVVRADEIGRIKGGSGFPIRFQGGGAGDYPFFKVSDMSNVGNEIFMSNANNYIDESVRRALGAVIFPANSIVFAKVGAAVFLERKKILTAASCLDNNMAGYILDRARADSRFVHYLMLNTRLSDLVSTTALPALNSSALGAIQFLLPSLPEQTAIAAVLSDMDAELAALEARLTKTRALKQAMMQELLTGKTRLLPPEDVHG